MGNNTSMAAESGQLQWEAPATPDAMSWLRRELSAAARQVIGDDEVFDITLATSEVLGNVVRHAYHRGTGRCRLSFSWSAYDVLVVVEDDGDGFVPELCEKPREGLGSDAESGRGLLIARAVVDEMHCVNRSGGGSRVELTRILPRG